MRKKRSAWIGCTLGFLAVLIGEAYCLLNFRGDYIMAAGVGIVLLIMAYLMLDAAFDYWESLQELEDVPDGSTDIAQRQGFGQLEEELRRLRKELSDLLKAEMQYERENTRALISHNKKEAERFSGELAELREEMRHLSELLEKKD